MNETWTHGNNGVSVSTNTATNETAQIKFEIVSPELYVILNEIVATVTMVISLTGVISNAINIKTFILMGIEDGVTVTFLMLSISDFCYTIITFVQTGCALLASYEKRQGVLLFKLDPFAIVFFCGNISMVTSVVTALITTYLATVRCLCVAKPLHFKMMFTRFKSTLVLATFPVIAMASHLPLFSHMGMTSKFDPNHNASRIVLWLSKDRERVKDITRLIFLNYVPFISQVIVVVCVVVMTTKLRKSIQFRQKQEGGQEVNEAQKLSGKELNVVIQVVVICSVYMILNLFKMFITFLTFFEPKFDMGKPYQFLYIILSNLLTILDCINSSVNFFVYFKFNSRFRSLCFAFSNTSIGDSK